jgi:hypothetical protein
VKARLKRRESCAKIRFRRTEKNLPLIFTDLKQKKTYRGFARMNADQEEKAKTFETQRNGGSGGNK